MRETLLALERCFFQFRYISDASWLSMHLHDRFLECGKSGRLFSKADSIKMLLGCGADRKITVYNFSCDRFDEKCWLVHYVTKSTVGMPYFRTSLWVKEGSALKMYYHQASPLSEPVELIETP